MRCGRCGGSQGLAVLVVVSAVVVGREADAAPAAGRVVKDAGPPVETVVEPLTQPGVPSAVRV